MSNKCPPLKRCFPSVEAYEGRLYGSKRQSGVQWSAFDFLFNGISNFVSYLRLKPYLSRNTDDAIKAFFQVDKGNKSECFWNDLNTSLRKMKRKGYSVKLTALMWGDYVT